MSKEMNAKAQFAIVGVLGEVREVYTKDKKRVWAHGVTIFTLGEKFEATLVDDPALLARIGAGMEGKLVGSLQADKYSVRLRVTGFQPAPAPAPQPAAK
jgi:hypothetical protein